MLMKMNFARASNF